MAGLTAGSQRPRWNVLLSGAACLFLMALPATASNELPNSEAMVSRWQEANGFCRGRSGDDPETWAWCSIRDGIDQVLTVRGFCYGKDGQPSVDMQWHACGPGSIPGKPPKNPYE
jgi:hypothetical protein